MTRYGPHDPDAAPTTVTVFQPTRFGGDYDAELPEVLVKQRERLNTLAHLGPRLRPLEPAETLAPPDPADKGRAARDLIRFQLSQTQAH